MALNDSPVVDRPGKVPSGGRGNASLTTPVFPDLNDPWAIVTVIAPSVSSKKKNKGASAAVRQQQVGGPGTRIPPIYGTDRVGARVGACVVYGGKFVLLCTWGEGEIDAVEQVYLDDEAIPASVTAVHYLGTDTQGVDPTLAAAFAASGQVYADTLPNVAYSVISVPPGVCAGFPVLSAKVRGLKVSSTSGGAKAFSRCPAYQIADFIENTRYGLRSKVNWDDVAALATRNNETLGGDVRNQLDLALSELSSAEDWLLTLCDYAGAIPVKLGDTYRLVLDAPSVDTLAIDEADTTIVAGTLRWRKRAPRETPTVVEVRYTDTSSTPWREGSAFVYAPGVEAGTTERIVQRIAKPGIQRYAEAYRYALQTLNRYLTSDLEVSFETFDPALAWTPGARIDLTAGPFTAKPLRIVGVQPRGPKTYVVTLEEYDVLRWSDTVASAPSTLDTALPSAQVVPMPTGLSVIEDVFQLQTGRFASRLVISWTGPTRDSYVYLEGFVLQISDETDNTSYLLLHDVASFTTPALPENHNYAISLVARSGLAVSVAATASIVNNGKAALPSAPSDLSAYSINGESRISWTLGSDLDLMATELRWSGQSGTWEAATPLTLVPAPERFYATSVIPSGARRIWAKSRDSVRTEASPDGQESAASVYFDWTVDENNTSASVEYALSLGTLTNMVATVGGWATSDSASNFGTLFPLSLSNYTNQLATYHASMASSLVSADVDAGLSEACTVTSDGLVYENISGVGQVYIEYKVNSGDSWSRADGVSASVTARYFRVGIEWTTTETGFVSALGVLRKTVDITDRFTKDGIGNDFMAWMN